MYRILLLFIVTFLFSCSSKKTTKPTPKILVFSKTAGYRHDCIPKGIETLTQLGKNNNFTVDTTENASKITEDTLRNYAAVVFLCTTGDVLDHRQQADFERYIQSGGGFVGIHSATDTEYDWAWYNSLVGAQFADHPAIQEADIEVKNHSHKSTSHLPNVWHRKDEWYNFKNYNKDVKILMALNEKSYQDGKMGDNHPIAWYHEYDGGQSFYTGLGHTDESYDEAAFLEHVLGGIKYAMGNNSRNLSDATTERIPDDERFTKTILAEDLYEPTEMTVLPNGDVLILERRGNIKLYSAKTKDISIAATFDVYHKTNIEKVNAEEGMMGITHDPNFEKNRWIYIFYSPKDTSVNRLSRFKFNNNKIDKSSEQKILEFYSQRQICCHTGGSLAFSSDGLLYLSTGDNSTPFDEVGQKYVNHGFAPLDAREGHEQYDARRTSGNTNDLRGKILRIKINENGAYSIPEGNLFPVGTPKTRPEIYVMGCRNPYRLSLDSKTNVLYWGEVGPDAAKDSLDTRGPRGYDEVNRAAKPGNYGWPLFIGKSYAYHDYDYATGQFLPTFDPKSPKNTSRNNTGLTDLPPTNDAMIWYPYAKSPDFPILGTGSRNAMAGPIYYSKNYPSATRLPEYYDGKLLIYDWMRAWMFAVTIDKNGKAGNIEPFAPNIKMACPIDMEMGSEGKVYVLDYGKGWFTQNPESALYTIEYHKENLAPSPVEIFADKTGGKPPFNIRFTAKGGVDPEKKAVTYRWNLGYGSYKETKTPYLDYSFPVEGDYKVSLQVIDNKGLTTLSNSININAGNDVPRVKIALSGNQQFYFPESSNSYAINIEDTEDGTMATKGIDYKNIMVKTNYMDMPSKGLMVLGHQTTFVQSGKKVMEGSDCQSCHKIEEKSIGPSFTAVANRYGKTPANIDYLAKKIINGGGGIWGETAMSAHPGLSKNDAQSIADWVLGLGVTQKEKSLPVSGALPLPKETKENGMIVLNVTYTDKSPKSQTGEAVIALQHPILQAVNADKLIHCRKVDYETQELVAFDEKEGYLMYKNLDLTNVKAFELHYGISAAAIDDYIVEVRIDAPSGQLIANQLFGKNTKPTITQIQRIGIQAITDRKRHDVYVFIKKNNDKNNGLYVGKLGLKAR